MLCLVLLSLHEASLELSVCCVSAVSKDDAGAPDDRKGAERLSEAAASSLRLFVIMHPKIWTSAGRGCSRTFLKFLMLLKPLCS